MTLALFTIPCLADNYAFVLHNTVTDDCALVDAPEIAPIEAFLDRHSLTLTDILITHHHYDHVEGVEYFHNRFGARVIGAAADSHRLPRLHVEVAEGDRLTICGEDCTVIDVSGHTIGHIAFHFPQSRYAFTADSLMAMGCGRLFEGTPDQMWQSLLKLRALPSDTIICSGHEYTAGNAKFALTIEPENPDLVARVADITAARTEGRPTVPSLLSLEIATNPFLRADLAQVKAAVGMENASDTAVFAEIRARKDRF